MVLEFPDIRRENISSQDLETTHITIKYFLERETIVKQFFDSLMPVGVLRLKSLPLTASKWAPCEKD